MQWLINAEINASEVYSYNLLVSDLAPLASVKMAFFFHSVARALTSISPTRPCFKRRSGPWKTPQIPWPPGVLQRC